MERTQKHWTANSPHQRLTYRKPNETTVLVAEDLPVPLDGPCDGGEAGDLFRLHGKEAAAAICERVGRFGGRTK